MSSKLSPKDLRCFLDKVIRDKPTANYKSGTFGGIESVMKKYGRVHEINRTGSMLDNIIYYNLKLDRSWFDSALRDELLAEAGETVSLRGDAVITKYLIVQRRPPIILAHRKSVPTGSARKGMQFF